MKTWTCLFVVWSACIWSARAGADGSRKLTFHSPYDTFDLILNGRGGGTVAGKPADLSALKDVMPALTGPLGNECPPLPNRPDLTVKDGGVTRSIYVKEGLISDGKACLNVAGDGLFYIPIHRDFLIGPRHDSIRLQSPLKISRQGARMLSVRQRDGEWLNDNTEQLLNWDFLERFQNSLRDFDVSLRVQEGIGAGKPKVIVQSGGHSYEFFKVTGVMWAVKKPGMKWLEASNTWSFWYDFDQAMLEDRYSAQIRVAEDAGKSKDERMAALKQLEPTWSPNLRALYHKLLLQPGADADIQEIALQRLKRKPSVETAGVVIRFLEESTNNDLKREAGVILKLQNPKGPKYNPGAPAAEQEKTLQFWRNWWKQKQSAG
jgi:hypothetical protein